MKPGAYADLVAVHGDPLADVSMLEHVDFVIKGGEVIKEPPPLRGTGRRTRLIASVLTLRNAVGRERQAPRRVRVRRGLLGADHGGVANVVEI